MKDSMKLKSGFREKKGTYDLITTICNISDKRRAVQSYMDHVFSFSKILTPSVLTSSRLPDVGTLSSLTELIASFCQQRERRVWIERLYSKWFSVNQRMRQGFSMYAVFLGQVWEKFGRKEIVWPAIFDTSKITSDAPMKWQSNVEVGKNILVWNVTYP